MLPQLVNLPRARGVYCTCGLGGLLRADGHELLTTAGLDLRCVPG